MGQDSKKLIAKNLKKIRLKCGFKQEELSLIIGQDNSYISKLENAKMNDTINTLTQKIYLIVNKKNRLI